MNLINKQFKTSDNNIINYYEIDNGNPTLLIIHAQGTNASSYSKVIKDLSKKFHIILVDCYGHGKSSHNREKYNIVSQGNDLIEFIEATTKGKDGKLITIKDVMIQKVIAKAIQESDLNAVKYIVELIGESPSQKIEVTGKDGKDLINHEVSKEEAKKLIAEMSAEFGWDKIK